MYAVYGQNTMANARTKLREPDPDIRVFDMLEAKRQRAIRQAEERARQKTIAQQRKVEIDALLAKGRAAAAAYALKNRDEDETERFRHSHHLIETRLCRAFRITRTELHSRRRNRRVVLARQAIMYWSCRLTLHSLPEIGRKMAGLDHTTVLHGRNAYPKKRAKQGRFLRPVK